MNSKSLRLEHGATGREEARGPSSWRDAGMLGAAGGVGAAPAPSAALQAESLGSGEREGAGHVFPGQRAFRKDCGRKGVWNSQAGSQKWQQCDNFFITSDLQHGVFFPDGYSASLQTSQRESVICSIQALGEEY